MKEVLVVVGVMIVVEEAVVAHEDVCLPVGVSIGVVDVYASFVMVCAAEVAGLAVVVFVHSEAAKLKQRAIRTCIKRFDVPLNM